MAQRQDSSGLEYTECYVFIDDSNLWIAGQQAQGKKLKDADIDPRYRVDLGRFLFMVLKDRSITRAFLYGSIPPPNDTLWNAARKKNFDVKTFERSRSGKEKKVDVAMATDITELATEKKYSSSGRQAVFIIVTGDRDMSTPVQLAIGKSDLISVELWAWDYSMAREFRQLANAEERFTVNKLDDVETAFSYREYKSTRASNDIDPARAVVFRDVPNTKKFYYSFANDLMRLLRLFYITCIDSASGRDLIVEFPKSNPAVVLREMKRCKIGNEPCSYPEYTSTRKRIETTITIKNRFEALAELEDSDDEAFTEAIESSLNIEPDEILSDPDNADDTDSEMSDTWISAVRRKAGKKTQVQKRKNTPCQWGIHCSMASECPYLHTENERKIFRVQPYIKFKYWKAKLCDKVIEHTTQERQAYCPFAHSDTDSWCLKCKLFGHLTDNCKAR